MGDHVTATGFSVEDIELLGDLPDYARLSGIPLPKAYTNFKIDHALPRPYRPFRWGYFQNMSLSKMEPDWWFELNRDYGETIKYRQALFGERGPRVLQTLPGCELAAKELMEMALQFLCARYPNLFYLDQ
ncbi:hypothetical protein CLAFUW4_05704 [Fulvia fulva]|uniref:Uncharacterized protein n=1 Tax=Passalora fulva TaxID=5499 RepID=A0A9Q8LHS9_PASFU|nr:uncharacterized protein CLAFUR5_05846 [Fulvia fulva]KAK4623873.1 hypothetical protein CLAFUR4_05698 [Fulvia fulva]KAK4625570.1 hypothetical protein CLAFUR0_05708 [Fulvia fulva]UJO17620.1 hypothetical protein CLAFUR5_05846 [Fulvia fulva]WPV15655.1 hypothetical protein CLAFUW4_05704 [Fulvia fulva]WPV29812.1 hypothetical protein CLAFUW7_05702 [Fulvia fulva]